MKIPSWGTPEFWKLYKELPRPIRELTRKNYLLWSANAFHPSLHFKSIHSPHWSLRIGNRYRAVGHFSEEGFLWTWIGSHEDYNKRF